ncbi:tRNA pseudouridine(55) synthase TruB [Demequina sp.]|uniref:tRNA pseudouridine(55) synthase TruB n=1 Tax=Demequina sp. TaxID=2050685 RepID=UPI0025BE06C8|nr:tRNA pseudouridine(55) synthase TruB [Demequina sp.]
MARRIDEPTPGLLLVDKPAGWTSHDVVARSRRILNTRKVGHAGTLDPMATGLLVLAVGRATRLLTYVTGHDKSYDATIRLGSSTITDDAEGEVTSATDASAVSNDALAVAIAALTGDMSQVPSSVSAIKVNGERSYARVRAGEEVALAARPVTVSRFEVTEVRRSESVIDVDATIHVSSGTYIRALARDLGAALGVGGHLTALRRTRIGRFDLASASTVDSLAALADSGADIPLISLDEAAKAALPALDLTEQEARDLSFGKPLRERVDELATPEHDDDFTHDAAAVAPDGRVIAVVRRVKGAARPVIVFAPAGSGA